MTEEEKTKYLAILIKDILVWLKRISPCVIPEDVKKNLDEIIGMNHE